MIIYVGFRSGDLDTVEVHTDGARVDVLFRERHGSHRAGFWGYVGPDPLSCSKAILRHAYPEQTPAWIEATAPHFMQTVVAKLSVREWTLTLPQIADAVKAPRGAPLSLPKSWADSVASGAKRAEEIPTGLGLVVHELARKIWQARLDPDLYFWAKQEAHGAQLPTEAASMLADAVTEHHHRHVDDDDFAVSCGAALMAIGVRVKLLLTHADGSSPRVQLAVLAASAPDDKEPWISHDHWRVIDSQGWANWPEGATVVDPVVVGPKETP